MNAKKQGFDMEKENFRYVGSRCLQKWTLTHETQQLEKKSVWCRQNRDAHIPAKALEACGLSQYI